MVDGSSQVSQKVFLPRQVKYYNSPRADHDAVGNNNNGDIDSRGSRERTMSWYREPPIPGSPTPAFTRWRHCATLFDANVTLFRQRNGERRKRRRRERERERTNQRGERAQQRTTKLREAHPDRTNGAIAAAN